MNRPIHLRFLRRMMPLTLFKLTFIIRPIVRLSTGMTCSNISISWTLYRSRLLLAYSDLIVMMKTSWRNDFPWNDVTPKRNKSRPQANAGPIGSDLCDGSVYLLKAGPYYKIGKSINFDQRLNQIKLQLPYPIEVLHRILTDDVTGIESYWHRRFAMKRTNGE